MDVQYHDFKLKHDGRLVKAQLSIFQPKGQPLMYRVWLDTKKYGDVIILYPQNKERTEFFYYPLDSKKELLAKKIITKIKTLQV